MREVKLKSGAILKVGLASFAEANALYKALMVEAKGVSIAKDMMVGGVFKDLFCSAFSSPEFEKQLWVCMGRCTYNSGKGDLKIDSDTFEPLKAREDYMSVCMEVGKENLLPFMKNLFAEYHAVLATLENSQQ